MIFPLLLLVLRVNAQSGSTETTVLYENLTPGIDGLGQFHNGGLINPAPVTGASDPIKAYPEPKGVPASEPVKKQPFSLIAPSPNPTTVQDPRGPWCFFKSAMFGKFVGLNIGDRWEENGAVFQCIQTTCQRGAVITKCVTSAPGMGALVTYDPPGYSIMEERGSGYCTPCPNKPGNYNAWTCIGMGMSQYTATDYCKDISLLEASS